MTKQLLLCLLFVVISIKGSFLNNSDGNPQGLLIVGGGEGFGDETQLFTGEVFIPSSGKSCSIPELPDTRISHTMDSEYLCGGNWVHNPDVQTTCLKFEDNQWTYSHTLSHKRSSHSSWMTNKGLLLMGGWLSATTTELLPLDGGEGVPSFELEYKTKWACAIPDMDSHSVILTGGGLTKEEESKFVSRYNLHGFVEYLPRLTEGRSDHGCGSYRRADGTQVMLVAGGLDYRSLNVASTEILVGNSGSWQTVTPLPALPHNREGYGGIQSATLGNTLYMSGGYDGMYEHNEILEWKDDTEEWVEIGTMKMTRSFHSMTPITVEGDMLEYCG